MNLLRKISFLFRRAKAEADMSEEMRLHVELQTELNFTAGMGRDEARYAALRQFGNVASIQEQAREAHGWGWLERVLKDLRLGVRQLAKSPGFSFLAIITLGLGIGANTAMFSVLNGILLKPLPYRNVAELERVYRVTAQNSEGNLSPADYLALKKSEDSYGELSGYTPASASLSNPGHPAQMAYSARAAVNLFALLGVQPQIGRDFLPGEDMPGRDRVVILSQRTWLGRFGGEPDMIGRTIRLDGEPHQVIGVLPASFNDWRFLGSFDFFRPLALTPEQSLDRKTTDLRVIGRRAATLSPAESAGFIASFGARLAHEYPAANAESTWRAVTLQKVAAGASGLVVLPMLIGLSAAVLLIACSNLANLLLARTMTRAREFAVRAALGASRVQLLRPLIAEALLLSIAGGGLAFLVAHWFRDWAAMRSTGDNGEQVIFTVDGYVLAWTLGASLVTALAFAIAPALFAMRLNVNDTLKSGGRGMAGSRGHQRFRQCLIVGQFAMAMVLLAAAALFLRGLDTLQNRRAGWDSAPLVTGTILLPVGTYGDADKITAFHRLTLERLGALPGVGAVSISAATPFFDWTDVRKITVDGQARPSPGKEPAAMFNTVTPQYFTTFGTRLVAGRGFTEQDTAGSTRVLLVSQATARVLFGEGDPLGRRIAVADSGLPAWGEIVGVVADILSSDPEPSPVVHRVYQSMAQEPDRQAEIAVRAAGVAPSALVDAIRSTMTDLDADLPVSRLQPADDFIARTFYQLRFLRDMLTAFGVLGLGLASLGIYGVIARTTAQRTSEFAIRLALGASGRDITGMVLGTGVRQALLGAVVGLLGAFAITAGIAAAFPGIKANNPLILAGTAGVLVSVALLACWLPARRAAKVDPMLALRAE